MNNMNTNKRIYGYARVSTKHQILQRQIDSLVEYGVENQYIITEKESAKDFDRPEYQNLKTNILRAGDTLVIAELDRLGRNKEQIKQELDFLKENKIRVKILKIPTTLMDLPDGQDWVLDMINNILIEVLGAIAEEERKKLLTRQKEGYDAMPKNDKGKKISLKTGKVIGRPSAEFPDNWTSVYNDVKSKKISNVKAMEILNVKKTTFYKLIKIYELELGE